MMTNIKKTYLCQLSDEKQKLILKWIGSISTEKVDPELYKDKKISELDTFLHFYSDDGSQIKEIDLSDLLENYERKISHVEYQTFESWIWDMNRCGLVVLKRAVNWDFNKRRRR